MVNEEEIATWESRKGKFCMVDYQTPIGLRTAMGKLVSVANNKLLLMNLSSGEEYEISIDLIKNSKIKEWQHDE